MKKIGIDPGHGGKDRANRGLTGYIEADGVLDISKHCANHLLENGYEITMTRERDETLSLRTRADILNKAQVDIAVSIHSNATGDYKVRGVETIHSINQNSPGKKLARIIYDRLHNDLGLPGRRVFSRESETNPGTDYYGIIKHTAMPCVIVEVEFHSNPKAEALLKDPDFRKRAGVSIAEGIMEFREVSGND